MLCVWPWEYGILPTVNNLMIDPVLIILLTFFVWQVLLDPFSSSPALSHFCCHIRGILTLTINFWASVCSISFNSRYQIAVIIFFLLDIILSTDKIYHCIPKHSPVIVTHVSFNMKLELCRIFCGAFTAQLLTIVASPVHVPVVLIIALGYY